MVNLLYIIYIKGYKMVISYDKRGYSLLEVALSVALLALVWIAVINMITIGKASTMRAKHQSQAISIIQQEIEELHKTQYGTLENITATVTSTVTIDDNGTPNDATDDLAGTQDVTVTTFDPDPGYLRVIVAVTWNEIFRGQDQTLIERCGTYVADDTQVN